MARTTENTFLMLGSGSPIAYSKLVDIKEFPDLGGAPNTVDVTTLTDHQRVYLMGLKDPGILEFTANYDATDYATIAALTGEQDFAVWFGVDVSDQPDGNAGKFEFKGQITCWVAGGSVEAAVDMGIAITTSTEITKA
ncbi:MAG: hypothetical protein J6S63_01250 [Atopobiaceae bacterium]|nr:hypothetical protein [Atopobiaceae bacterium]